MIAAYNAYINRLLTASRQYRENPSADTKLAMDEVQHIHKAAAAFEEIIFNLRMGMIHERLAIHNADKPTLCTLHKRQSKAAYNVE